MENGELADQEAFEAALDSFSFNLFSDGLREVYSTLRDSINACANEKSCRDLLIVLAIAHEGIGMFDSFQYVLYPKDIQSRGVTDARDCFRRIRPRFIESLSVLRADLMLSGLDELKTA